MKPLNNVERSRKECCKLHKSTSCGGLLLTDKDSSVYFCCDNCPQLIRHRNIMKLPMKTNPLTKVICPTCHGMGKINRPKPYGRYSIEQRALARELFRQGMTLRKIGVKIGLAKNQAKVHPQKVWSLINAKTL